MTAGLESSFRHGGMLWAQSFWRRSTARSPLSETFGIIQDVDLTKCAVSQAQGGPAPGVAVMAALHDLAATRGWGGLLLDPLAARWLQQQVRFPWYL